MKQKRERVPREQTWLYHFLVTYIGPLYRWTLRVSSEHAERVPREGGFIAVCNHIHALDPVTLAVCCPGREIRFMGKESLFRNRAAAAFLRTVNVIPVARGDNARANLAAVRSGLAVLRAGMPLGVFPEGHRYNTGKLEKLEQGAALVALQGGAMLVPAHVEGAYGFRKGLKVTWGEPFRLGMDKTAENALENATARISEALTALFPAKPLGEADKSRA